MWQTGLSGTASPRFGHDFIRIPVRASAAEATPMHLAIDKPADEHERVPDHVLAPMTRMPEPQLQRACACGGGCPECQTAQAGQEQERLATRRVSSSAPKQTLVPPIVHEVSHVPGRSLASATRNFIAPRLGHDFGQVRAHADVPQTMRAKLVVGQPGDIYEREADQVATAVMRMPDSQAVEGHVPTAMQAAAPRHNWLPGRDEVRRQPSDLVFEVPDEKNFFRPRPFPAARPSWRRGLRGNSMASRAEVNRSHPLCALSLSRASATT